MRPGTINTILNNAPLVIQGASRLVKMIKERHQVDEETNADNPVTLDGLTVEIEKLNHKLDENSAADVEQIELIEQLARQNEIMAESIKQVHRQQTMITRVAVIALIISIMALVIIFRW